MKETQLIPSQTGRERGESVREGDTWDKGGRRQKERERVRERERAREREREVGGEDRERSLN